jgi:hypothetical protein
MIEQMLERRATLLFGASLVLLGAIYLIVGGIYRPQNLDDGWALSYLYQFRLHGIEHASIFKSAVIPGTFQDGVFDFSKIQSFVYGTVLDLVGWTQAATHAVSTLLIAASAVIWGLIAHRLTGRRSLSIAAVILLLFSEAFFGPANQSRAEALTFFLASAAFALYMFEFELLSGLLVGLAFEVHPTGLYAGIYVASAVAAKASNGRFNNLNFSRSTALLVAGLVFGFGVYVALHSSAISNLPQVLASGNDGSNILTAYFIKAKYFRHVPELIFFVAMVVVFVVKRHWNNVKALSLLIGATGISILLVHRESVHYALYVYAPLMLISLWVVDRYRKLHLTFLLCVIFFTVQYAAVYYLNRSYSFDAYSAAISKAVPNDGVAVVGTSNDWFIFKDRNFYAYTYGSEAFSSVAPSAFYLIRNDSPYVSFPSDNFYVNIHRIFNCIELSRFNLGGEKVQVDRCER